MECARFARGPHPSPLLLGEGAARANHTLGGAQFFLLSQWERREVRAASEASIHQPLLQFFQSHLDRLSNLMRPVAPELRIDMFQLANQIDYLTALVRSTGGRAEMCPTTERPVVINHAVAGRRMKQGTGAIHEFG